MKKMIFACTAFALLAACQSSPKKTETSNGTKSVVVLNESDVTQKKDVKLSELVEDFRIVRMDNRDEALFKLNGIAISENYICIKQGSQEVIKLYDKAGKFITNVGAIGQGPGEYSFIYDIAMDEKNGYIYVSPFASSRKIMQYNLKGEFVNEYTLKGDIRKGRVCVQPDGAISLAHLCFTDIGDTFTGATIPIEATDSIQYVMEPALASHMMDPSGAAVGYNNEIWSYRNAPHFPIHYTHSDTLYHYDHATNEMTPQFAFIINPQKKENTWFILNELPRHYLVIEAGPNSRNILMDKASGEANEIKLINDFMGNMETGPWFVDGYYYNCFEPIQLQEALEEALTSDNCPKDQVGKLTQLKNSLKENDNNVMFLGKLKQ